MSYPSLWSFEPEDHLACDYKEPVKFERVDTVAERLTLGLSEGDGKLKLSIHNGDRLATLEFNR